MASITGLTGSTTNSASSLQGYGGLVSGLDRDTLIQGMTSSTRVKIAKQQQQKQLLAWKQEAYRSVSSKLVEFARKYTSYTSPATNLSSSSFWAKSSITAVGENSKYVSVSGSSSLADTMSIVGVKQMAKNASMTTVGNASDRMLKTGSIDLEDKPVSALEGYLSFQYGADTYTVSLSGGDYSNGASAQASIKQALQGISIENGKSLADVIDVKADPSDPADPAGTPFTLDFLSLDTAGNTVKFAGGSSKALAAFGVDDFSKLSESDKTITSSGLSTKFKDNQKMVENHSFVQQVAGKSISFTYNGTTRAIKFGDAADVESMLVSGDAQASLENIKDDLQKKLNKEFGTGRIEVSVGGSSMDGYHLKFKTTKPEGGDDDSSILELSYASAGILGKDGALNVIAGESNRVNVSASLAESGLNGINQKITDKLNEYSKLYGEDYETTHFSGSIKALELINNLGNKADGMDAEALKKEISSAFKLSDSVLNSVNEAIDHFNANGDTVSDLKTKMEDYVSRREMNLTVNGTKIEGLSYTSSLSDIVNKVNASDAGVTMSYMTNSDKIVIKSKEDGASGRIDFRLDPNLTDSGDAELLFGKETSDYTITSGQDAIVRVKYDDSSSEVDLVRGTNTFTLDGLNIIVNGTFGYDKNQNQIAGTQAITFNAKADSDKIVSAVSDMIKDYNDIIKLVNDQVSAKPNRSYSPLTDEQKEDMSEDQITKWEEKAKEGLLFNDTDLRGLVDSMRFIFESGSADKNMLESFGISTSATYSDNGKLIFDETKFRTALESSPDDLQKLFTKTADSLTGEKGGVMARISSITNNYASTTGSVKGILIEKAGSVYAPTSILTNYLQKSMDSIDSAVSRLQDQLSSETDRYIKQFTNLETLISQMNSQSSWLQSAFG
ncbi:MAG: flagellar filament capping protein FliD [Hungatella sp.]|jgi:flagellar hook-associated protein 2|nr:flagellar filament capping protein FliD [Hungatella sp.]